MVVVVMMMMCVRARIPFRYSCCQVEGRRVRVDVIKLTMKEREIF
tara:strand:+ start:350 stop:484 length:135 start_codon:yes stop_codon:yes gene_type:complete